MASETLLTRLDLEALWGMTRFGVSARIRKYGQDVRKVQKGNTVTFAVTRAEADRIELAAVEAALEARRKSGATRTTRVKHRNDPVNPSPVATIISGEIPGVVTSVELQKIWNLPSGSVWKRIHNHAKNILRVKIGSKTLIAVAESEVEQIEADSIASRGATKKSRADALSMKRQMNIANAMNMTPKRKKRQSGWQKSSKESARKPSRAYKRSAKPCPPTVEGVKNHYGLSTQTIYGQIADGLIWFDSGGLIASECMERLARCYHPANKLNMKRLLAGVDL